jgi:hypothetical protein
MSIAAKLYNRILLNRIRESIDRLLRNNQAGFRIGRSCIQQINILRRIMEGAEFDHEALFITFVDFKKAFDSIDRDLMFAILRHYGIPESIVAAIRSLYYRSSSRIFVGGQLSEQFAITTGVLQGDIQAPFLFIIVIDYISKIAAEGHGFVTHEEKKNKSGRSLRSSTQPHERKLNDLDFADDIALLESSEERSQKQLDSLKVQARKVGLEINVAKTEQIRLNQPAGSSKPLTIDGSEIAIVEDFKYLGSHVANTEADVNARIGLGWAAFNKLKKILTSKLVATDTKLRLFDAACLSILLYGAESWLLNDTLATKLDIYARKCYRMMLDINQSEDHVTNEELYKRTNRCPVRVVVRERQLRFVGHCLRMPADEPSNIYALYTRKERTSEGPTRKQGRPKRNYYDQIADYICDMKELKPTPAEIANAAKDRSAWKMIVVAPKKPAR